MADPEIVIDDDGDVVIDIADIDVTDALTDGADIAAAAAAAAEGTAVTPTPKPPAAAAGGAAPADAGAEALRKAQQDRASAEATAAAALRSAAQARQEADGLRERAQTAEVTTVATAITNAEAAMAQHKAELKRLYDEAAWDKVADVQADMATLGGQLAQLKSQKAQLEAAPPAQRSVDPAIAGDPAEGYISQFTSPEAQAWLRSHKDYLPPSVNVDGRMVNLGGDSAKNARMMRGHHKALAEGVMANTPDYFRIIEEAIGERSPVSAAAAVEPAARPAARPAPRAPIPSAPPSRETVGSDGVMVTNGGQARVKLNKDMRETALFSYPAKPGEDTEAWKKRAYGTYAREYASARSEGKIGRTTH